MTKPGSHTESGTAPTRRRTFLAGIASATAVGVAGCAGDDVHELNIGVPPSGTTSNEAVTALQRAVSQESDEVEMRLEETSGDPESIRLLDDGQFDGYSVGRTILTAALNDLEPFDDDPVEETAVPAINHAGFHHYWVAVEGSGIEDFDDIVENDDISPYMLPPAWGLRRLAEIVHREAGVLDQMEDRIVNLETSDAPGAVEEGNIDALVVYGNNFEALPGWVTEVDARSDVYFVEPTDTLVDGMEAAEETAPIEFEPYAWEQDIGDGETTGWAEQFYTSFSEDVPDDVVREVVRVSHEHNDVVREAGEVYMDHSDIDDMVSGFVGVDIHSGALDYYEDNGANIP